MDNDVLVGGTPVSARWLRDHGDDAGSVDPDSLQRVVDTFAIPRDIAAVSHRTGGNELTVEWTDGATTVHHLDALAAVIAAPRSPRTGTGQSLRIDPAAELWSSPTAEPERFDASVIVDDDAWPIALDHLRRFGWVAFDGAVLGPTAVKSLVGRVGYPRASIFGDVWKMAPGDDDHKDSAYDPVALDVHTDGTYSHDAPGTILFAQQERAGTGGASVLIDGFAAAADFVVAEPEAAELLTRYDIRGRYVEPGVHLEAERPPLRVDSEGVLRQVSFNNYDRAPVLPAAEVLDEVLDAYAAFRAVVSDPARALVLDWEPGRLLLIDNWRMLHGRTSYTGSRMFLGCYSNHEDLESAYRLAGLVRPAG